MVAIRKLRLNWSPTSDLPVARALSARQGWWTALTLWFSGLSLCSEIEAQTQLDLTRIVRLSG